MSDAVQKRLDRLINGNKQYPDLYVRSHNYGARVYDCTDLVDGKLYYFLVHFDWRTESGEVVILSATALEISGPH
jgi:hypothetical protein